MRRKDVFIGCTLALALLRGTSCWAASTADQQLLDADKTPHNWLQHGRDYAEQRFSPLKQIDTGNVANLGLAWAYELDTHRGQEATPLVVDGVLYTTTAWNKVVALRANTGEKLWEYDPKVPGSQAFYACCDVVNRGAAYYDGKLFFATLDGRLIALRAATGELLWSTLTVDPTKAYSITGAPRVVKGRVVIGNSGGEYGVRGYVSAYDAASGALAWRFYTVPGDPAKGGDGAASDDVLRSKAAATWSGRFWEAGGGGTVWDAIVYDQELDQLYIGVGNGSPQNHVHRSQGKGDNLFLSSIVALDPDTGHYRWHYQQTPGETWDYTAAQPIILADLKIDGAPRKVLLQAPKNGFFYVIDRLTGRPLSAQPYVPVNWATGVDLRSGRPIEVPGARYLDKPFLMTPGAAGGHNWQPMSFNPDTGLVYLPVQELPQVFARDPDYKYNPETWNLGIEQKNLAPADAGDSKFLPKARLLAWDPVRAKPAWSVEHVGLWNGGTLSTAGNLVFEGTQQGQFMAFDARDGRELWRFDAQAAIMAGPVSFAVDGEQYVAVLSGYGGAVGLMFPEPTGYRIQPPGRVLVFKLGGKAQLARQGPWPVPMANPPAAKASQGEIDQGAELYAVHCAKCHAMDNMSAGVLPDLRRSAMLPSAQAWSMVVMGGALQGRGMVSFAKKISPAQAELIRAYVGSNALKLKQQENTP
ncbi:PQQ-dependent dehydrogenase, methanol/ethanol family [Pseudomonas pudica]|uniref:PQQ-dependent dehydrogenase, methanol/ethanol family n=1 Tax=Pseudomonas pudica TaxID=272772 RepID=UPI003208C78A